MLKEIKIGSELKCLRCGNKVLIEEIKLVYNDYICDWTEGITCLHCGNAYDIQIYHTHGEEWSE